MMTEETRVLRKGRKIMEWINRIECPSPREFSSSYLMVETKVTVQSAVLLNGCRENTSENYIL